MKDEFYIGWQNNAPTGYAKWIKGVTWTVLALFILVGALLVMNQRGFDASTYEKDRFRILEGILITDPIPCLKILAGTDAQGVQHFERVLLVGIGKKSASPMLHALKKQLKQPIAGKALRLKGKLIYFDGVLAFELGGQATLFQGYSKLKNTSTQPRMLGKTQLNGEILDPKCYLGVMRPGEGKPHRSCAIRCIAGGIPPFFRSSTKDNYHQYFFVLDQNGRPINQEIAPYVADEVQICGQVEKWDNWYILKADLQQGFYRISPFWAKGRVVSMCQ